MSRSSALVIDVWARASSSHSSATLVEVFGPFTRRMVCGPSLVIYINKRTRAGLGPRGGCSALLQAEPGGGSSHHRRGPGLGDCSPWLAGKDAVPGGEAQRVHEAVCDSHLSGGGQAPPKRL